MLIEIETYQELLDALTQLTAEQRKQPVQIAHPQSSDCVVELMPSVCLGTVGALEFSGARSSVDNRYHAEEVVLLIDHNPFAKDGATAYRLEEDGPDTPLYDKGGPTPLEAQLAPKSDTKSDLTET